MNRGDSFTNSPKGDTHRVEKKSKAFKDISKYFSEEEWAELGYSEKITYVYMKRNYDTMTSLGLSTTVPDFMCPNRLPIRCKKDNSVENWSSGNHDESPQVTTNVQIQTMSQKPSSEENGSEGAPGAVVLKNNSLDSEQPQKQLGPTGKASTSGQQRKRVAGPRKEEINVWAHRLRERKNLVVYEEISDLEEDD